MLQNGQLQHDRSAGGWPFMVGESAARTLTETAEELKGHRNLSPNHRHK